MAGLFTPHSHFLAGQDVPTIVFTTAAPAAEEDITVMAGNVTPLHGYSKTCAPICLIDCYVVILAGLDSYTGPSEPRLGWNDC